MPKPFAEFKRRNMLDVYLFIEKSLVFGELGFELYNIPHLYGENMTFVTDKTNDYGTLQYTNTKTDAKASINIDKDYNVFIEGVDNDTKNRMEQFVTQYLQQAKFLP
ncbi:hypothetical protein CJD36_015550 [Flavipsychrobacter stenotrophus]|uniref:Uncharacterized protein n=1 Tax=Flavipsychrobacter stenotrophus TaxID=2077091 RepID=A0A2S7ST60_9BACT|nr:hypothetical protein [Flavipsychrobacter stenotrophus]PQJ10110.1 hypothetical protein CJD36_015550 [Flavipsychrobacter stenotrophus]